jgi:tripartite-type tricarboxylate transporter receptor subunit TctC
MTAVSYRQRVRNAARSLSRTLPALTWAAAVLFVIGPVFGQGAETYPSRPIKFVVPFPPGSGTEVAARFIGHKITELTGQPVVIEPRGGGNGFIGVQAVLAAPPDGYTLFFGANSTLATNVALFRQLPYDPLTDFVPVSLVMKSPILLLVPENSPYKTLGALIEAAKREPGKLTMGTGSAGYQMMGALFAEKAGIELVNIPYKSSPDTVTAVIGGQVVLGVADVTAGMPLVRGGKARALAIASDKRLPSLSEIPTAAEQGLAGFTTAPWTGLVAPARVPKPIVDKLSDLMIKIMAMPETRQYFVNQNTEPMQGGQVEMRAFQREEIERWKRIAVAAKVELQ